MQHLIILREVTDIVLVILYVNNMLLMTSSFPLHPAEIVQLPSFSLLNV